MSELLGDVTLGFVDGAAVLANCARMVAAFLLALPIGWDRERAARSLGLRTFPLVAMASCGFVTIGMAEFSTDAQARVLQGLITGVGFLGGGAILQKGLRVFGTATAASIWVTAALGAAVAYGRFEVALVLSLSTVLTLRLLVPVKELIGGDDGGADDPENGCERKDSPG